jgi:hypothetical protein
MLGGKESQLQAVVTPNLLKDVRQVTLSSLRADRELLRHIVVRVAGNIGAMTSIEFARSKPEVLGAAPSVAGGKTRFPSHLARRSLACRYAP